MQDYRLRELFKPTMAELGLCMYQFEWMIQGVEPVTPPILALETAVMAPPLLALGAAAAGEPAGMLPLLVAVMEEETAGNLPLLVEVAPTPPSRAVDVRAPPTRAVDVRAGVGRSGSS
ncbi:UNVERIFIED_CONTAM: hypothetical protein FKN15_043674 [Acipenser sinensis]